MNDVIPNYPKPAVPLSPIFSWYSAGLGKNTCTFPSIADCKYKLHLTSGRAAIALALEHAGVAAGDEVLIPAFHCESMVAPIKWLGAKPIFYPVNSNATINSDDISQKVSANTRAIIATHYFGFLQDLEPVQAICKAGDIRLIEDCAHAFFGSHGTKSVGTIGDYAIASSMKFFPVLDGGLLASDTLDISNIELQNVPASFQLKSMINSIEKSADYKRFGLPGRIVGLLIRIKEVIWRVTKKLLKRGDQSIQTPSSSTGGQELEEDWIRRKASFASRAIVSHSNTQRIVEERRNNYRILHNAFKNLPDCHPFYADLPEGTVPLVFPLCVHHPDKLFRRLKQIGVPIWRFGEYLDKAVTTDVCANSVMLSAHIFQFPCHQELREEELVWIIDQVTREANSLQMQAG